MFKLVHAFGGPLQHMSETCITQIWAVATHLRLSISMHTDTWQVNDEVEDIYDDNDF